VPPGCEIWLGLWRGFRVWDARGIGKEALRSGELGVDVPRRAQTVVSDPDKAFGEDVEQKTAEKLDGIQGQRLEAVVVGVVLDDEGDLAVADVGDAVV